jgi:adenylate cyclase
MGGAAVPAAMTKRFDPKPVFDWLTHDGYLVANDMDFMTEFAERVAAAGLPMERMTTGIPILHPQIAGYSFLWTPGEGGSIRSFPATEKTFRMMAASPIRAAYQDGQNLRCPIAPEPVAGEYPILTDLRTDGFTDYSSYALRFSDGSFKAVTVATRRPGGFDDTALAAFESLLIPLAPLLEVRTLKLMSRSLLDIYIGPTAGGRVLNGEIRRGEGEVIQAVIWFSDLRDSTDLSNAMSGPEMIGHLNEFFSLITTSVNERGGEVLKFIGDSVLAIFPCESVEEVGCMAAHQAEAAARDALERAAARNAQAAEAGRRPIEFGIALHIGEVFYGNVGGDARLDFTVIGPAVNLAARIESATKETQRPLLASEDFARISRSAFAQVGAFAFNGIGGWTPVYAPEVEPAPLVRVAAPAG